jgi:hypothetical protein
VIAGNPGVYRTSYTAEATTASMTDMSIGQIVERLSGLLGDRIEAQIIGGVEVVWTSRRQQTDNAPFPLPAVSHIRLLPCRPQRCGHNQVARKKKRW